MPKLLHARPPQDGAEERQIRKLATSRHAPAAVTIRARLIIRSWAGLRTAAMAAALGCHPQTVRERLARFKAVGLPGLADRPGAGRRPRLTQADRSRVLGLVATPRAGRLVRQADGTLAAADPAAPAQWTLTALAAAATAQGLTIAAARCAACCARQAGAGGVRAPGPRARTPPAAQKDGERRLLHRAAARGDDPLCG